MERILSAEATLARSLKAKAGLDETRLKAAFVALKGPVADGIDEYADQGKRDAYVSIPEDEVPVYLVVVRLLIERGFRAQIPEHGMPLLHVQW